MTTHVFIVDATTFKLHLEYLFAGTGSKKDLIDFNSSARSSLHPTQERNLVAMIADASRIRKGDQIIFYLQQDFKKGIGEGKFFGVFEAKGDWSFLDNNDDNQYLRKELGKSLTFRTLIAPLSVYPEGVTEWDALDEIKNLNSPNQMLWSLIYRKLKGNRGNTMLTIYEAERLVQLIRYKNQRHELACSDRRLSFDADNQRIVQGNQGAVVYTGRNEDIDILPRLMEKHRKDQQFEVHLQAYIIKLIGTGINRSLDEAVLDGDYGIEWLGNEVSCGVGMRKMDIVLSLTREGQKILAPIELKSDEADENNANQIQRYVEWIRQYYTPNSPSDIQPILLTRRIADKETQSYQNLIEGLRHFNGGNRNDCAPLRFVEFFEVNDTLEFERVTY